MPRLLRISKTCRRCFLCSSSDVHETLSRLRCISEAKKQERELKESEVCRDERFRYIFLGNQNLIKIPGKFNGGKHHFTMEVKTKSCVQNWILIRCRSCVESSIISGKYHLIAVRKNEVLCAELDTFPVWFLSWVLYNLCKVCSDYPF